MKDPRDDFLSEHFRLSDFLGNHSVYAKGYSNDAPRLSALQRENAEALCTEALEPLLERFGPLSIAYGLISPDFSRRTVKYQDPDKPSHHRWDLGAAADVISHKWVQGLPHEPDLMQLFASDVTRTSPALLAHAIDDTLAVPYSRLISYSESAFLCIAVSATEVASARPRKAFYENRFAGVPRAKPEYIQQATPAARQRVRAELQQDGLPSPWQGGGFPSYHGGGIQQYQHMQVSKYTTVLDWLFNLKSISSGHKNIPALVSDEVQDAFAAAGLVYDYLVDRTLIPRFSILGGYVCRSHPDFTPEVDWRNPSISFEIAGPATCEVSDLCEAFAYVLPDYVTVEETERGAIISVDKETILSDLNLV